MIRCLPCACCHDGGVSYPCGHVGQQADVLVPTQSLWRPQGLLLKQIPFAPLQHDILHPQMGLQGSHSVQEPAHCSWVGDVQLYTELSSPLTHHRDLKDRSQWLLIGVDFTLLSFSVLVINYKTQCLCCCNGRFSGLGHVHTALLFIKLQLVIGDRLQGKWKVSILEKILCLVSFYKELSVLIS